MDEPLSTTEGHDEHEPAIVGVDDDAPGVALGDEALTAASPEVLATSLGEYFAAWGRRIRNGESGAVPVLAGLVVIVIFFQLEEPKFLTALNLVNLLQYSTIFVMFAAAEIFALLLSEIDLSLGYIAGVGAFVIAELIAAPVGLPWWLGILGGVAACGLLGFIQGTLITRLNLPSFIVTLAGSLAFLGLMIVIANADSASVGGVMNIDVNSPVYKLVQANMSTGLGWAVLIVGIVGFGGTQLLRSRQRRAHGLTAPPTSVTLLTIGVFSAGGIVLMLICSTNRSLGLTNVSGVPWVLPFTIVVLLACTFLLERTRTGRYIYAIGANPEAARRAGINVARVKTFGFVMVGLLGGLAGLVYESYNGSMATDIPGGTFVLYAVGAAVIGGTSLFGGRGKPVHALLGGIVLGTVFNGLGLMSISAQGTDIATAIVLLAAVTLDSLVRRRATAR